jgi:hypothetical protein
MPLSIIMFRITELRYKRVYGCRKKRLNTGRFFDNHYKSNWVLKGVKRRKEQFQYMSQVSKLSCGS